MRARHSPFVELLYLYLEKCTSRWMGYASSPQCVSTEYPLCLASVRMHPSFLFQRHISMEHCRGPNSASVPSKAGRDATGGLPRWMEVHDVLDKDEVTYLWIEKPRVVQTKSTSF
jgi:hypothetical protein